MAATEKEDTNGAVLSRVAIVGLVSSERGGRPPPDLSALIVMPKQVIVTSGAFAGIGKEIVRQLASVLHAELTIWLLYRSVDKGRTVVAQIQS